MRKTEVAKHFVRERKQETQKELRQRRRELSTPSIGTGLRQEERELREEEELQEQE